MLSERMHVIFLVDFFIVLGVHGELTIQTRDNYFLLSRPIEVNCTSSSTVDRGLFIISIDEITVAIKYESDTCQKSINNVGYACGNECSCGRNKKWVVLIYNVTDQYNGTEINIKCTAMMNFTEKGDQNTLKRAKKPEDVSFNTSTQETVNEGQKVGPISCTADCIPECNYTWISPCGVTIDSPMLLINDISRRDNGSYECKAENLLGTGRTILNITVEYGPHKVSLNPANKTYKPVEGTSLVPISCSSECYPECNRTWTGPGIIPTSNFLILSSLNRTNTGQFICKAANKFGILEKTVNITVQYAAEVTGLNITNADNDYVLESTSIHFMCGAIGEPEPFIKWLYTDLFGLSKLVSANDIYSIQEASCNDTGTYTCKAHNNGFLPHNRTKLLNVTCGPRLYEGCSECNSNMLFVKRNQSESVSACFLSNPTPESYWNKTVHNNTFSLHDNVSSSYNHSNLLYTTVVDVTLVEEREINLTVFATNFQGSTSTHCRIRIQDKPSEPTGVYVSCKETNMIHWISNFNGGIEQLFIVYFYESNETILHSTENISDKGVNERHHYEITDLTSHSDYSFYIVAMNKIDSTKSKVVTCTTSSASSINMNFAAVGGGTASGIVCVSVLVIGIIFYKRRLSEKATEKERSLIRNHPVNHGEEDDDTYSLKDNPMYISNEGKQVNYSVVSKQGKRKKADGNLDDFNKNTNDGNQMSLLKIPTKESVEKPKKNKDGLIYADLDLAPCGSRCVIRGIENKTKYAMIDLTKTAEPLPPSDEEDTKDTD